MNQDLTEIACVVDRSGSMESIRTDAIGGFNGFLAEQRAEPGEARVTVVLFDDRYEVLHESRPIAEVPPLDERTYVPRNTTALLDAVGRTIDELGARLAATPEPQRPGKVIVAILTDGLENASRRYTRQDVFDRIRHQREKYAWEFVYLGANQDAFAEAERLAIPVADAAVFLASPAGVRDGFAEMSAKVREKRGGPRRPVN